jgi:hypothetical protein
MSVFTVILKDSSGEKIQIKRVDESGTLIADYPIITIALGDLTAIVGTLGPTVEVKLREWKVCIDNGDGTFTSKNAVFLSSDAYT